MEFSGEEHLHQLPHEQFKLPEACWCNGASSNLGDVTWVQHFMALLKPSIGEEVEKALNRVIGPYLELLLQRSVLPPCASSLPHQAESSASRSLHLQFKGDVPDTLLTMTKIEDEGASLEVELLDESGKRVEVGLESSLKIKIDVLDGDFDVDDKVDWTEEDYNRNIAEPRKTKGALLKGKCEILMSRGVASVSHISFTDNSKSMRNETFRLGAKIVKGLPPGVIVKAAVSEAFRVKERRLKNDRKHKTPSPEDDLWRLVYIRKNGPVYQRALKAEICTVKDFLQCYHTDPKKLQRILDVPEANWNAIVENAKASKLTNECYIYNDAASGDVLLLDCAFSIVRVTFKDQRTQLYDSLDESQKEQAHKLRCAAYEKRSELPTIHASTNQITEQELTYLSSVQGQEKQRSLPPIPPTSGHSDVGGLCLNASSLISNQMCSIRPRNLQYYDGTAADQGPGFFHNVDDTNWDDLLECFASTPLQEEMSNVSDVSAPDHVTRKLIAACYVTKAATLFMIAVQQDPSAPKKKRKLQ